jgi:hemolysin activation/secretion protein
MFGDLLGDVVTQEAVETRLYQLNQLPGVTATAWFSPGAEVGETVINLDIAEQRRFTAAVQMDNQGREEVGENRLGVRGAWLNPLGRGDLVDFGLLSSVTGSGQLFGYAGYRTPLMDSRHAGHIRLSRMDFNWSGDEKLSGDAWQLDTDLERTLMSTRTRSGKVALGASHHRINWSDSVDQSVNFLSVSLKGHRLWDDARVAVSADAGAKFGRIDEVLVDQDERFWTVYGSANVWRPLDLPLLSGTQKVSMQVRAQHSGSRLPSTLRLGLGGANDLRGFEPGTFMADSGAFARLNLHLPSMVGEWTLFADYGYGHQQHDNGDWAELANLGFGWHSRLPSNLMSRVSVSKPITSRAPYADNELRIYWSVSYER